MTVSVLIPAKGPVPYLKKSLDSVLSSTLKPDEILLVDDGIDPSQLKYIKSNILSPTLRILNNDGVGLVDALNTGVYSAKSTFIARLDSDDLVNSERFTTQIKILGDNPEIVVLGSQIIYIDQEGGLNGVSNYPVGVLNEHKSFYKQSLLAHPSVMIRKTALIRVGGYRETVTLNETSLCEDFDLWRRIADQGTLVNFDTALTYYRQHDTQLSVENSAAQALATFIICNNFFNASSKRVKLQFEGQKTLFPEYMEVLKFMNLSNKLLFVLKAKLLNTRTSDGVLKHFFLSKCINLCDRILRLFS